MPRIFLFASPGIFEFYVQESFGTSDYAEITMVKKHINERGSHTTFIEGAKDILKLLNKAGLEVSPGIIEGNVKARGRSIKLKKLNSETFEMIVVANSSKQTFKVYGKDQKSVRLAVQSMKADGWNILDTMDMSVKA